MNIIRDGEMNTIEETLWDTVRRTHADLQKRMIELFVVNGSVVWTHYVPQLVPVYRAHRLALEKLFEVAFVNPRDNCYYLGIRQLEQYGRRAKANSEAIPGIPELPPLERIFTS